MLVESIRQKCLSKLILVGEAPLSEVTESEGKRPGPVSGNRHRYDCNSLRFQKRASVAETPQPESKTARRVLHHSQQQESPC